MMALALMAVFIVAKIVTMWGRPFDWNVWTVAALFWQDMAVVLAFWLVDRASRAIPTRTPIRVLYGLLVIITAFNVPVQRVLSSPLTLQLLHAARGTISDSIAQYVTVRSVACVALVLATGILMPRLLSRVSIPLGRVPLAATLVLALSGFVADHRVDVGSFGRNPVVALARSALPRVRAHPENADWRASPFDTVPSEDVTNFEASAAGRSVLMIVLESTAARYMKAYGAEDDPTPNVTALAQRALLFEHAYAVYPESVRDIVAFLASRFPAFDVGAEDHGNAIMPSLASILSERGYATALFHSGRFMYLGMDALLSHAGFGTLADAGDIGGNHQSSFGVDEPATVDTMLHWVDAHRGSPFFLAYLPIAGHHPYAHERPGPWPDSTEFDRYRNALHEGDAAIGALLSGLAKRGLIDSTLVVVFGDHGEAFGQHAGNFAHTLAIYDENVRVPLMFVVPGEQPAATRINRTASLVDVPPTVLSLLGIDSPPNFQGTSLLLPRHRMALFFTDYSLGLLGLRDGCTKYITELETSRSRLYDLCRDPDELDDIASRFPERTTAYRDLLQRWSAAQVASVRRVAP